MSVSPAYLGIDLGGTGAKAGVFDDAGRPLGSGRVGYSPAVPAEGRAEIPIAEIYEAARSAACQAVREAGAPVAALAVSSQGQTFVSLDAQDRPLHPAIVWYDSRAAEDAAALAAALGAGDDGPLVETIATAPKILWLRRHLPEAMSRARRYLLLPDYLAYRLTGEAATDPSTASSTGLYADGERHYCPAALAAAGVEREALARIQEPGTPIARVRPDAAREWGLPADALLVAGTNDQYAGALGAGNCRPGILSVTTGTCLALVTLCERPPAPRPGILSGRFPVPGLHFALAYAKTAGLVLEWFQRLFTPGKSLEEMVGLAAESPAGSRGLTVLPHFDGMVSPAPNEAARGAFLNLTLSHSPADLARAILESVAFSLRENRELLAAAGLPVAVARAIGGGARSDLWLQIKADVAGLPVERPAVTEAATLGAAMLAAVGHGRHQSLAACSEAFYRPARVFAPDPANRAAYEEAYRRYREGYARLYGGD